MSTPFPKTVALVKSLGIDPDCMALENLDTTGYDEFVLDENGKKIVKWDEEGNLVWVERVRREWPSLADGIRVIDQFIQEGGYRR